jgi:hypothetical protein
MKTKITKKIFIDCTLDSSEMIMATKGGKHKIELGCYNLDINAADVIEISFQLEKNAKPLFDHTFGQANVHKSVQL